MSSEWPLVRLGDHVDACLGKMLDAKKNKGIPQPYLGNSNVRWGEFDLENLAEMKFEAHEEERYSLRSGDLVVCEGGEPGRCAIWIGPTGMKIQKALHRIRPKEGFDNYYLFYWLRHAAITELLEPSFTGTTIKHLTGKAIAALELPQPPIAVQRAIADVLKQLDDRITLLHETNATLEAIAQALFKSWFVDFDPVRAKMEGRALEGMDEATAALFPNSLDEWGKCVSRPTVEELIRTNVLLVGDGYRAKNSELGEPGIPFVRGGDLAEGRITPTQDSLKTENLVGATNKAARPGDTAFTSKGTIGRFAFVDDASGQAVYSPQVCFWRSLNSDVLEAVYLHFWMKSAAFMSQVNAVRGQAAIMDYVSLADQRRMKLDLPPVALQKSFSNIAGLALQSISSNRAIADSLITLRDTLLPRLVSGELRLPENAEALDEDVCASSL